MVSCSGIQNNPGSEPSLRLWSVSFSDYPNGFSPYVLQLELMHPPSHVAFHISTVPGVHGGIWALSSEQPRRLKILQKFLWVLSWSVGCCISPHFCYSSSHAGCVFSMVFLTSLCSTASQPGISTSVFKIRRLQCHVPVLSVITSVEILHSCLICRYSRPELCSYISRGLLFLL